MPNATVWQREVTLPIGYLDEESGMLHRQVTLRKMTGKEEALLAEPALRSNGGRLISALLANCVTHIEAMAQIEPEVMRRMFSGDRNFLLLELRRLTFGDDMEASYRCPHCQGVTTLLEDLSNIPVRVVEDEGIPVIAVTLTDGYRDLDDNWQYEFVFGLPTGEDEEVASGRRDSNPTRQRDALLARCLKQVGNLDQRRIQAMGIRILADLSMPDRRQIQKAVDATTPGPDLTRQVNCDRCGEEYLTTLDMSHFFPTA